MVTEEPKPTQPPPGWKRVGLVFTVTVTLAVEKQPPLAVTVCSIGGCYGWMTVIEL